MRKLVKKSLRDANDGVGFVSLATEFYRKHERFVRDAIAAPVQALGMAISDIVQAEREGNGEDVDQQVAEFLAEYADAYAARHVRSSEGQWRKLVSNRTAEEAADAADQLLDEWEEKRAAKISRRERTQLLSATAVKVMAFVGVLRLVSRAVGKDPCPICIELDGKVVGINEPFVQAGEKYGNDATNIEPKRALAHTPWHDGCDCQVFAE